MRLILYLGKGGVGKTTVAAATALRCAQLGHRTLVVSTDIAHSLADVLDRPLQSQPRLLMDNLWAQEINVLEEIRTHWGELQEYLSAVLRRQGVDRLIADELAVIPGMEEVVSLLHIRKQAIEGQFDRVIVDAAPTGETMRLLTMPDTFRWYAERILSWGDRLSLVRPLLKGMVPNKDVLTSLPQLSEEVAVLRKILVNPEISSYRVVLNPERMVIKEAQRAATYLSLFDYPVDAVVVNRVLPDLPSEDPYLRRLQEIQRRYLAEIEDTFSPLPILRVPWYDHETVGLAALARLANDLFGDDDPGQVLYHGRVQEIVPDGDDYLLRLPLPHVELNKVRLTKRGDELFITIGNFKRDMLLPHVLAVRDAVRAVFRNGMLEIRFQLPHHTSAD